jgi:hypothetical protein
MPTPALTESQKKIIHDVYYNKKFYFGRDKLFHYLMTNYPKAMISQRQVMNWLKDQELAQLFNGTKKTKDIQSTVLSEPYKQLGMDIIDMQSYEHDGYNYILTMIDLFSKKAWAIPLKNKESKTVANGFKDMLKTIDHKISSIRSDNGSEFVSKEFKKVLNDNDIKQVLSNAGTPQSNGQIERFNGVLKQKIKMYITKEDKQDWNNVLDQIVDNYNNIESRVTKMTPNELDKTSVENQSKVINANNKDIQEQVKQKIRKEVIPKNERKRNNTFSVGDKVRLKLEGDDNQKTHELWTRDIFTISKVHKSNKPFSKPYYFVEDDTHQYTDKLYENDLQKINNVENPVAQVEKYIISKIIKKRNYKGKVQYLVHWKGYSNDDDSWMDEDELMKDIPKMVKAFNKKGQ